MKRTLGTVALERLTRWRPDLRIVAGIAGGLLLLGVVGAGLWFWSRAAERQATAVYAMAMARTQTARAPDATAETRAAAIRELETAMQTHPAARMTAHAAYELGGLRFAARQYAEARGAYEIAMARASSPTLKTLARLGVAATWEAGGDLAKAAGTLQALVGELAPADPFLEQALLDLARVQEATGQKDQAVATYRRALKDPARGMRGEDIRIRLASLGATP